MNYQYRYGGELMPTIKKLYAEGGVPRFYRGLAPALFQAPVSRFGDTAANDGALAALEHTTLPTAAKTMCASAAAASFRVVLMPVDAWKTTKQVEGKEGLKKLIEKSKKHPTALWQGALGAMSATWVGHYPWFYTNNQLRASMPQFDFMYGKYVRNAVIGFASAAVSDTCSNSLRVLKTTKRTSLTQVTYGCSQRHHRKGWCCGPLWPRLEDANSYKWHPGSTFHNWLESVFRVLCIQRALS